MKKKKILEFIDLVRTSFVGSDLVYTRGSCYRFYLILKNVFPESETYYDLKGHVVTKIGDFFYDINGEYNSFGLIPLYCDCDVEKDAPNWIFNLYSLIN